MDTVYLHGSVDQSLSPYKWRNPRIIQYPFINSWPSDNFLPSHFLATSLLQAPPPFLSQSYPPGSLRQPQPPLLPLPATDPRWSAVSYAPANKKTGKKTRDTSLTPKKPKSPKKGERNSPRKHTNHLGADPKELRKHVVEVVPLISSSADHEVDMFSGSAVFTISPPPSSLPLPTFSLRPKLSCKAEAAAGIDAGATDDLRRLLRLL